MLQDITLGQFFPGKSILHRMDPRMKLGLLFVLMILIFTCNTSLAYGIILAMTVALIAFSRIPFILVLKSLRPIWWILLFTFIIHLFSHPGEELYKFLGYSVTWEGFREGVFISLRLALLVILSSLLTFTTSPLKLTDALERILSPGKRIGLPAHELAMMMTIALRFVPTLVEETDKIMKAQTARGSDFTTGNVMTRLKSLVPILVPLFLSAFRRADELAMAMEARCYRGGEGRTHMKSLYFTKLDYYALTFVVCLSGMMIYLRFGGSL